MKINRTNNLRAAEVEYLRDAGWIPWIVNDTVWWAKEVLASVQYTHIDAIKIQKEADGYPGT